MRPALVLAVLAVSSCAPAAPPAGPPAPSTSPDPYTVCDVAASDRCAGEVEATLLAASGGRAFRRDGVLHVRTASAALPVEDTGEGEDHTRHLYAGWLPGIAQHVVVAVYSDGESTLLVDSVSGRKAYALGRPVVSPDGRRFATAADDAVAEFAGNGIELWRVGPGGAVLEWRIDGGEAWSAGHPAWIDGRTLEFTRFERDGSSTVRPVARMRATLGDGSLEVRRVGPPAPRP